MAYHIRNITSEQYYTGNPSKPWVTNVEQSAEYETKGEVPGMVLNLRYQPELEHPHLHKKQSLLKQS